ncbi:MAG: hypothetical protein IJ260_06945 [Butyrivibrio sp.]|nr:hypothetical protein [Butyrivibrio sp.]MBQ8031248.1 hypothetical protein [Butyrivibrio sp.]MBR1642787.1 hypothetical protein [Butyrivibrio sp.]
MNKYQRVMEHVKVDDDMRKRILQNVENELSKESKVVQFGRRTISQIRKHAGMAAMFAILLLGTFAVARITGGITHTSAPTMSDTAMEAPAPAEEAMVEDAAEAAIEEEAAEATYDNAEPTGSTGGAIPQQQEVETQAQPVDSAKTERTDSEAVGQEQPSAVHYNIGPVLILIIVIAVIALLIWAITSFIKRRRK